LSIHAGSGSTCEERSRSAVRARRLLQRLQSMAELSEVGAELSAIELALDAADQELEAEIAHIDMRLP
jgi:hypothetical protein